MKKLSLLAILFVLAITTYAQDNGDTKRSTRSERKEAKRQRTAELMRQAEEGTLVFQKQSTFGLQLRTNGYGAFYELARMKTNRRANIYRIDFQESKHNKEQKQQNNGFFGNPFIYGKLNYFYPITIGFGQQYILGQKGNKNGVSVAALYNVGLAVGLLRPYYVTADDGAEVRTIKYSQADSALFLGTTISGSGGFGKGWSEIKVKPGGFAKIAMRFDYGRFNETVAGLEIGMSAEVYASEIPILFAQKEKRLFYQGYVAILFGRRR